ncbi:M48 family metallopeptidase [Natronoarchaeum mannanilyticum]|uniref:Peptidase M48 domain-containing protein n=2 Tax=Natronoarchaeum mannanilyticum TaxID=926360 RepID=A0AAV3TAT0_9EURY
MALSLTLLAAITGAFVLAVAAGVRMATLVLLGSVRSDVVGAAVSYRPSGLSPWLTIVLPAALTVGAFAGLAALDRWRRGLLRRRFEAGLRDPPDDVERALANLSRIANVPTPTVRVAETAVPTAFTTGARPGSARITVTRGLLERLSDEELRAVLAHELSHVKNRDVSAMTVAMGPVVVAEGLWTIATEDERSDRRSADGRASRSTGRFHGVLTAILGVAAGLFWIAARLATARLARHRELAADRGAAAITGEPSLVAATVQRLDGGGPAATDLRAVGIEAFAVAPLSEGPNSWATGWQTPMALLPQTVRKLLAPAFSYHPDTERRVRRLQALEGDS